MDFSQSYKRQRGDSIDRLQYARLYIVDCLLAGSLHQFLWYLCGASAVLLKFQQVDQYVIVVIK